MIIFITGALGTGKTTIAKKIADQLNGLYLSVDQVLTDQKLDQMPWGTYSIPLEHFLQANELMKPIIMAAVIQGQAVIVDGCFYHQSAIDDLTRSLPPPQLVFTLQAPLEVCIERDKHRPKPLGEEVARAVYHLTSKVTLGTIVDTTLPLEQSVEAIVSGAQVGQ